MVTAVVVTSYQLFGEGLVHALGQIDDILVAGSISSDIDTLGKLEALNANVVVMDVSLGQGEQFELLKRVRQHMSKTRVLIIGAHTKEPIPMRFMKAGAAGYVSRSCSIDEVRKAIFEVAADRHYLSSDCAQSVALHKVINSEESPIANLSERELQVMMMIIRGQRVAAISDSLCISPKTINTYRYRLFAKLDVDSDVSLTLFAIRNGIIQA